MSVCVCVWFFTFGGPFVRRSFLHACFFLCFSHWESQRLLVSWTRLCSCLPGWFCSGAAGRKHQGVAWLAMLVQVDSKKHQMTPRAWPLGLCLASALVLTVILLEALLHLATTCLLRCSHSSFNAFDLCGFLHLRTGSSGCWAPRSKSPVKKRLESIWEASGTDPKRIQVESMTLGYRC